MRQGPGIPNPPLVMSPWMTAPPLYCRLGVSVMGLRSRCQSMGPWGPVGWMILLVSLKSSEVGQSSPPEVSQRSNSQPLQGDGYTADVCGPFPRCGYTTLSLYLGSQSRQWMSTGPTTRSEMAMFRISTILVSNCLAFALSQTCTCARCELKKSKKKLGSLGRVLGPENRAKYAENAGF